MRVSKLIEALENLKDACEQYQTETEPDVGVCFLKDGGTHHVDIKDIGIMEGFNREVNEIFIEIKLD